MQADPTTSREYGGTGLGLAIASRLVQLHRGSTRVESRPGEGTSFFIELPLPVHARPSHAETDAKSFGAAFRNKRVVFLYSEKLTREVVESLFADWGITLECIQDLPGDQQAITNPPCDLLLVEQPAEPEEFRKRTTEIPRMEGVDRIPKVLIRDLGSDGGFGDLFHAELFKPLKRDAVQSALETCFADTNPKAIAQLQTSTHAATVPREHLAEFRSLRVLVAEDNEINRRVVKLLLQHLGLTAEYANNGQEAVEKALHQKPDVILMDLHMPGMDGKSATKLLRKKFGSPVVPWIIALTADVLADGKLAAMEAGVNDYLSKPVRIETLEAALRKAAAQVQPSEK